MTRRNCTVRLAMLDSSKRRSLSSFELLKGLAMSPRVSITVLSLCKMMVVMTAPFSLGGRLAFAAPGRRSSCWSSLMTWSSGDARGMYCTGSHMFGKRGCSSMLIRGSNPTTRTNSICCARACRNGSRNYLQFVFVFFHSVRIKRKNTKSLGPYHANIVDNGHERWGHIVEVVCQLARGGGGRGR